MKCRFIPRPLLLSLFCLVFALIARAERLPIKIYTSADGLGSSYINYLMRDSHGFLWICTRDGLNRFDGARFVTYQVGDKGASPGIEQIFETRKGIYWIVTTSGLYRFDPNALSVSSNHDTGRPTLNVQFMSSERGLLYEDGAGVLWMIGNGLSQFAEKDGKVVFNRISLNLPSDVSNDLFFDTIREASDGSMWLATARGLLRRFSDGKEIFYRVGQAATVFRNLLEDRSGLIWVGAIDGVYVINPEKEGAVTWSEEIVIRDLNKAIQEKSRSQDPVTLPQSPGEIFKFRETVVMGIGSGNYLYGTTDGHIWISNLKTVTEFDGRKFQTYSSTEGFVEGITRFAEDVNNNLWLGGANGLLRLDRGGLKSYLASDGLLDPNVLLINQTRDGRPYVVTRDLSLSVFDGKGFQAVRIHFPPKTDVNWTSNPAFQDSTGEWWFATTTGLYRFAATNDLKQLAARQPRAIYNSSNQLKSDEVSHVWEDTHHDLWIVTRTSNTEDFSLYKWSRGSETFHAFSEAEGYSSNKLVTAFAEDKIGNLWFGFYDGGLARYANGRLTEFTVADGAPVGLVTALYVDHQGRLWIGSSQIGLVRISDPSASRPLFTSLNTDNGLASNNVRSITEDFAGNVYVGTARGIDRLSPDAERIRHFSTIDGLAGDFVAASFCDGTGGLWFGTPNGLSRLIPSEEKSTSPPPVMISGLRVAGERRSISDLGSGALTLPELAYSQNNLQLDFFGIDFGAGESLRYQYKLEGADRDWSAPTDQRTVTYANLQPGTYQFLVRAINADGLASIKPAVVSFKILAPIWLRWWFIVASILLIVGVLFALYRYRVTHLRQVNAALMEAKLAEENLRRTKEDRLVELERVRKRIATDLHDDIGSTLTRISLLSEVAQRQPREREPSGNGSLSTIASLSRELVDSMSDIVWAINPERDSLGDLTQRMRHFASDVFSARGIDFRVHLPDSAQNLILGANIRRELFLIFKEAVNNCVKHSECSEALIDVRLNDDGLLMKISDNGQGFDTAGKSDGHGLASMRSRAVGLGGSLIVESSLRQGSALIFNIPLRHQQDSAATA